MECIQAPSIYEQLFAERTVESGLTSTLRQKSIYGTLGT